MRPGTRENGVRDKPSQSNEAEAPNKGNAKSCCAPTGPWCFFPVLTPENPPVFALHKTPGPPIVEKMFDISVDVFPSSMNSCQTYPVNELTT